MDNFPHSTTADVRIELKIPAAAQWVRVARLTVAGVASRLHFDIDAIEDIKLAVAEAINNAILHASIALEEEANVTITLESDENGLWISVADEGRMQGGLSAPEKVLHPRGDELPEGGMGLLLIQSLMDEVTHESGAHADTVVKMFKRLPEKNARGTRIAAPRA
ncbi:ATP-binding protein [Abditibacterium utsteinense]|uniref:ATP-binding protein n=1 Tax=Abditibacterium utsteinense TaxID=1960156 RepID=UPI001300927E|nr:ATP-binding protein [Abditibacterium utsteinense]